MKNICLHMKLTDSVLASPVLRHGISGRYGFDGEVTPGYVFSNESGEDVSIAPTSLVVWNSSIDV